MNYLVLLLSYLIGSFPTAYIIGRLTKNVDIRSEGSGNVGGMNMIRVAGIFPGLITILVDTAKGAAAVAIAESLGADAYFLPGAVFMVVCGHNFNIFLKFKGGKGLAAALGAFLVYSPQSIGFIILTALVLNILLKDTNTAFGLAMPAIPTVLFLQHKTPPVLILGLALALVIMIKHIPDFIAYKEGRRKIF